MYNFKLRRGNGRRGRLTVYGLSTRGRGAWWRKGRLYPGAVSIRDDNGGRDMARFEDTEPSEATVAALQTLERHAYVQIAMCIDEMQLDDARKIVEVLKGVGIV